jgi:signal transduction histidine kinase
MIQMTWTNILKVDKNYKTDTRIMVGLNETDDYQYKKYNRQDAEVNWKVELEEEQHGFSMRLAVDSIKFEDGKVYDGQIDVQLDSISIDFAKMKSGNFGFFTPESVYFDSSEETPLVTFEFWR